MKRAFFLIMILFLVNTMTFSQHTMNVQGILRGADGKAVTDGTYQLTFSLYEQQTGGSNIWTESHNDVETVNGVYTVELGSVTSLANLTFTTKYYLGITVGNDQEMTPRLPLSSFASAVTGTDNIFPSSGDVGIGVISPSEKLDVNGQLKWGTGRGLLSIDQGASVELGGNGTAPFIDFSNDATSDYDARVILAGDDDIQIDGTNVEITEGGLNISGNVGIGLSSPSQKLDVNGSIKWGTGRGILSIDQGSCIELGGNGTVPYIDFSNDETSDFDARIILNGDDYLDIAGTNVRIWNGIIQAQGFSQSSDSRLKTNIEDVNYGLNDVLRLHPVTFDWKENPQGKRNIGLIAQEVKQVIHEVVSGDENSDEMMNIGYTNLVPVLIKAIQEQQDIINRQGKNIHKLEQDLKQLKDHINLNK